MRKVYIERECVRVFVCARVCVCVCLNKSITEGEKERKEGEEEKGSAVVTFEATAPITASPLSPLSLTHKRTPSPYTTHCKELNSTISRENSGKERVCLKDEEEANNHNILSFSFSTFSLSLSHTLSPSSPSLSLAYTTAQLVLIELVNDTAADASGRCRRRQSFRRSIKRRVSLKKAYFFTFAFSLSLFLYPSQNRVRVTLITPLFCVYLTICFSLFLCLFLFLSRAPLRGGGELTSNHSPPSHPNSLRSVAEHSTALSLPECYSLCGPLGRRSCSLIAENVGNR